MAYDHQITQNILSLREHDTSRALLGVLLILLAPILVYLSLLYSIYLMFISIPVALVLGACGLALAGGRESVLVDRVAQKLSTQSRLFMFRGGRRERVWHKGNELVVKDRTTGGSFGRPLRITFELQIGGVPVYETHKKQDAEIISHFVAEFLQIPRVSKTPYLSFPEQPNTTASDSLR